MHIQLAHQYWKKHLKEKDHVIDATCGNGQDALFLANITKGSLFLYDIQEKAFQKTRERFLSEVSDERMKEVHFLLECHSNFSSIPQIPIRLVVYNLGYLPGGDKGITTQCSSTLQSIESALELITEDGAVSITCYPGHDEGAREEEVILSFLKNIDSRRGVLYHKKVNRAKSPTLIWVH